ncbi:hypothetical protein U0070_023525 [Myodes glareolus]|uniref:Uncharacterized protein n=1 Tax=Myodes glareolus TaxID=447135 RepID=A0AAW0HIJ0_MYOGA
MWTPLPASTSPGGGTTDTCPGSPLIAARSAAGLLPGVTSDQDHVRGVVMGVTDLSLRLGAPCSYQIPLHLDPVRSWRASIPDSAGQTYPNPHFPGLGFESPAFLRHPLLTGRHGFAKITNCL